MNNSKKRRISVEVSAGSMADIAFLLLIFFLVATTLNKDEGIMTQLPPDVPPHEFVLHERNHFKIHINSNNNFLIEDEPRENLDDLIEEVKAFVMNPTKQPHLADSPQEAIVSIKTQRGTDYGYFIKALDNVKEAYYQMYGERVGLTSDQFRALDRSNPNELQLYNQARENFPMKISIAEPDQKS